MYKKTKLGRPFTTKIPRETVTLRTALREGIIQELLDHYGTNNKSEAVRKAIYEILKFNEEKIEKDSIGLKSEDD